MPLKDSLRTGTPMLLVLAFLLCSCAATAPARGPEPSDVSVYVSADGTMQWDVKVYAVLSDGTRKRVGITDITGSVTISPAALRADGAVCLLFEKDGFFTGAIWLSEYRFSNPDLIALARFVIL